MWLWGWGEWVILGRVETDLERMSAAWAARSSLSRAFTRAEGTTAEMSAYNDDDAIGGCVGRYALSFSPSCRSRPVRSRTRHVSSSAPPPSPAQTRPHQPGPAGPPPTASRPVSTPSEESGKSAPAPRLSSIHAPLPPTTPPEPLPTSSAIPSPPTSSPPPSPPTPPASPSRSPTPPPPLPHLPTAFACHPPPPLYQIPPTPVYPPYQILPRPRVRVAQIPSTAPPSAMPPLVRH